MVDFAGVDILSTEQFSSEEILHILSTARRFQTRLKSRERLETMSGKILATFFYEPSTRTRLSFETAMLRLGGQILSVASAMTTSSAAKGETLYDTGKMIRAYADVAVIRHPLVGSAQEFANGADIPIINGGDGAGEHPTQALLDLYTIWQERGRLEDLTIGLVGDLKHGRTVHSLAPALALFPNSFYFVAPPSLGMPSKIKEIVLERGANLVETHDLAEATVHCDVLYVTRVQKERFENPVDYEAARGAYVVDDGLVQSAGTDITIMHPLPRVDEISREVDAYAGAAYFRQAANGVPVRMALLALVTDGEL